MNAVVRVWRYVSSLARRRRPDEGADPRTAVRDAIMQTQHERVQAAQRSGGAEATHAEIEAALRLQHLTLSAAREQIEHALTAAEQAAEAARADNTAPAASAYERAARGMRTQLEVVQTAISQLDDLRRNSQANVHRVQEMLRQNRVALDRALRAEVSLLGRLDRLERERAIAAAMLRVHQQHLDDR